MDTQSNRIPRPRNAFMIFRAQFSNNNKISKDVEHDHRQISRIVGHCWNKMSEEEKQVWRDKAHQEKLEHMQKYPNYRFTPLTRTKKPLKRNTKRNSEEDMQRCRRVADLLLQGKQGEELVAAVNTVDTPPSPSIHHFPSNHYSTPPFRSPLLPPSEPLPALNENIPSSPLSSASGPAPDEFMLEHASSVKDSLMSFDSPQQFEQPQFPQQYHPNFQVHPRPAFYSQSQFSEDQVLHQPCYEISNVPLVVAQNTYHNPMQDHSLSLSPCAYSRRPHPQVDDDVLHIHHTHEYNLYSGHDSMLSTFSPQAARPYY
ncbi:hypothetical protein CVT24_003523 [Panaeolus cyanescens]|uniref:HMG box domain-containing protein n=1 Tax=Panaeolus cyanescens TaxID=181874 RepID=A0A409Y750_9AGAR|nr:hypothetical protein CVT24_003523 [Panaeolus cyanescens]